jgi:outer membrane receptor protein involved in Fe transport
MSRDLYRGQRTCSFVAGFALLAGAQVLHAQINNASLSGLVTDASGSAIAHAQVSVLNKETGLQRSLQTNGSGSYFFQDLPIGTYTVTVDDTGFSSEQTPVTLTVGEKGRHDFQLAVGSAQTTVEVKASASTLSPDDASIGTVIGQETIEQTPLYLRNWDDLLRTVPGVQISRYTQQSGNTAAGRTGDFNVNGVHSLQNDFILDGIDNNTFSENVQELSTEASHPSVDVIQQFNVITNPYSAEYGRSPGAVVSVNTKSGTNTFHGLAYEYLRNNYFDANDFFSNRAGLVKPENNQNQFGGSIGGPVLKNHLFFFFNYEGTRIKQGVSRISTVPLDNERIGDFSAAAGALNGITYPTIKNPKTGQPFANNQIPQGQIDTAIAKLMALFPEPNVHSGGVFPELNNYQRNGLLTDNNDSYDGRVDWTASPKDQVFVRYNYSNRTRDIPGYFEGLEDGSSTSAWGDQQLKSYSAVLGWTRILSANAVNEFRFGWVRDFSYAQQQPFGLASADQYVPGIPPSPQIGGGVPLTSFTSYAFLGSPDYLPKRQIPQQYQFNDTVSVALGRQDLKIGVSVIAPMRNIFQDEGGARGDLTFTGVFTGFPYADGLLGQTQSDQLTNVLFVDQRLWMASGFVEDDWKATPKLTINAGLRYDFATPALEGRNQIANFNPAGNGSLVFAKSGSVEDRATVQAETKNFGPRFGVSFSPDSNTVLRAGYGIYYTLLERDGSEDQLALNPPYLVNRTQASNTTPVLTPEVGFPTNFLDASDINFNALQSYHIRALAMNDSAPYVQQYSAGVQHAFNGDWTAEVDYVGTKSTHLDVIRNYNQPLIADNHSTGVVPYANFGLVEYTSPIASGNYNGLQASLTHRFQKGLSIHAAYTYSRSLDNAPEELESNSGDAPNGRSYNTWYGPSDFDVPQRVSVNYVYDLPFGSRQAMFSHGPLSYILGGFRTSGVYTYYSGHPFTVNSGGKLGASLDPYGYATDVPYVLSKSKHVGDPTCWFFSSKNTACNALAPGQTDTFAQPASGYIGDASRNLLRGPRTSVFDASLLREFPFGESENVEFRWEVFNVMNTPLFGQPSGDFSSSGAGNITTLSGDPRVMQFALRLSF